jgi:hypothetical protein
MLGSCISWDKTVNFLRSIGGTLSFKSIGFSLRWKIGYLDPKQIRLHMRLIREKEVMRNTEDIGERW